MLFKKILVPVDLSTQSTRAFNVALDIAKKYDSKITLLTCLEVDATSHLYYVSKATSQQIKKQNKIVKKHFETLESLAEKNNVSIKSNIITLGSTVNNIVSFAKSKKYDLVVIGSHGRTGFDKFLLGSVANGVSQKAKCPVLIVK
jgi:nucleotide-binding universal stress UspA family protein